MLKPAGIAVRLLMGLWPPMAVAAVLTAMLLWSPDAQGTFLVSTWAVIAVGILALPNDAALVWWAVMDWTSKESRRGSPATTVLIFLGYLSLVVVAQICLLVMVFFGACVLLMM